MFGFLKGSNKNKLEKEYKKLMEKALHAQRNGNIELFANLSSKADKIDKEIQAIEKESEKK